MFFHPRIGNEPRSLSFFFLFNKKKPGLIKTQQQQVSPSCAPCIASSRALPLWITKSDATATATAAATTTTTIDNAVTPTTTTTQSRPTTATRMKRLAWRVRQRSQNPSPFQATKAWRRRGAVAPRGYPGTVARPTFGSSSSSCSSIRTAIRATSSGPTRKGESSSSWTPRWSRDSGVCTRTSPTWTTRPWGVPSGWTLTFRTWARVERWNLVIRIFLIFVMKRGCLCVVNVWVWLKQLLLLLLFNYDKLLIVLS